MVDDVVLTLEPQMVRLEDRTPGLPATRRRALAAFSQVPHRVLPVVEPTRPAHALPEPRAPPGPAAPGPGPGASLPPPRGRRYAARVRHERHGREARRGQDVPRAELAQDGRGARLRHARQHAVCLLYTSPSPRDS